MCLYITGLTVARLGARAWPIVLTLAVASLLVPLAIPSWHESLGSTWGTVTPVAIPVVAIASFGVRQVFETNRELGQARGELARLAAENERFRIARDLHDLLGHSLTTITVKAGLARRLGETDPARSRQEIAEVEDLARRSLADVRAAIANYRDVTLAGELATGRELLRAAGITADLPRAVDAVDPTYQELFGWVVREGLTNVVRHAHASSCSVRLSPSCVEIVDDGLGGNGNGNGHGNGNSASGNGLKGLRERVAAAGGVVDAGPLQPRGWRLRVSLAPEALA
jgi:two-component system sensor histidine kinase DesK